MHNLTQDFVGAPHWLAIIKLVGNMAIPVIVGELTKNVESFVCTNTISSLDIHFFFYCFFVCYDYFVLSRLTYCFPSNR